MSYFMTEEQILMKNSVRDFCQDPTTQKMLAAAHEKGVFPRELWDAAANMGFIGVSVPQEYGGQGLTVTDECIVLEEMTNNGFPLGGAILAHNLGMLAILNWGTEEQRQKYLFKAASGEAICCGAWNDPAGSYNLPEWGLTIAQDGDDYVINGQKVTVTNAEVSDIKVVYAADLETGTCNSAYIVEKGTPGLSGHQEQKLVQGLSDWGSVNLKNVRVPKSNKLDGSGKNQYWLSLGYLLTPVMSLSFGNIAFAKTLAYTSARTRYGKPLTDLQTVSHRLVDMSINNETSRCLIYTAARLWDEGRYDEAERLAYMAKIYVTETATKSLHDAVLLHGAIGFTPQSVVGPLWTNSIQLEIAEGTTHLHRDMVAASYGIKPGWKNGRP